MDQPAGYAALRFYSISIVLIIASYRTGFSYATDPNGYVTNEDQVAADFYTFIVAYLKKFPRFAKTDLYITGESYAGVSSILYDT